MQENQPDIFNNLALLLFKGGDFPALDSLLYINPAVYKYGRLSYREYFSTHKFQLQYLGNR